MRRLVWCRVFVTIQFVIVVASYFGLAVLHYHAPNASVFSGAYSPRFSVALLGEVWLWTAQIGIFFLLFDGSARDKVERVDELLSVRPISLAMRTVSKLLAVTIIVWVTLLVSLLAVQGFAHVSRSFVAFGASAEIWWLAVPLEGYSLAGFLLLDSLPKLLLVGALTQLLAEIFRNRVGVAVCFFMLMLLHVYWVGSRPLDIGDVFASVSRYGNSDILPQLAEGGGGPLKTFAHLAVAIGLVLSAIAIASGVSTARSYAVLSVAFVLVAILLFVELVKRGAEATQLREQWLVALREAASVSKLDLEQIGGTVTLEPGKTMMVDVELVLSVPAGGPLAPVVLSLNPGLFVEEASVDGRPASFAQAQGLVELHHTRPNNSTRRIVALRAVGVPDERYGYLDDERPWRQGTRSSPLLLLGTRASIFDSEYVALMPGVGWLPMPPKALDGGTPDFFSMDFVVEVPPDWSVVATGDRRSTSDGRHRFVSTATVPKVALFAAPFSRSAVVVGDVEFELYMAEEHKNQVDFFERAIDVEDGLVDYAEEMLERADRLGLPYPYRQLSFVEVPAALRTYGGGWRKDTAMALPGTLLIQEHTFPVRRYDRPPGRLSYLEDGSSEFSDLLWTFTFNLQGGNYHQLARNLFLFQTASHGKGATAIDQLCLELTVDLMWPGRRVLDGKILSLGSFSAHQYADRGFGVSIGPFFENLMEGEHPAKENATHDEPRTWDRLEKVALTELPTPDDDQGIDVMLLRTRLVREAIFAHLGFSGVADVLAGLRRLHSGTTFGFDDLASALEGAGLPSALFADWLYGTELPAFSSSDVTVLEGDGGEAARLHLSVHVRNEGKVPGVVRLMYDQRTGSSDWHWLDSDVAFVAAGAAVEVGLKVPELPSEVWLESFLSRNRRPTRLSLNRVHTRRGEQDWFVGTRSSSWRNDESDVVVDDQDEGFSVDRHVGSALPWYSQRLFSTGWTRQEQATAWGKYLRTVVRTHEEGVATFATELIAGKWRLAYHLPDVGVQTWGYARRSRADQHGTYVFRVSALNDSREFALAPTQMEDGWNHLGDFELSAGTVRVSVSNGEPSGDSTIYADAIRWSRLAEPHR